MSLRLAWAGPWNERSAIAAFGRSVVARFAALGHVVEVFRTETGGLAALPPLPAPGPVHASSASAEALASGLFDALIVNAGDHFGMHGAALTLLQRFPSVVILHDASMAGFHDGWQRFAHAGGVLPGLDKPTVAHADPSPIELITSLAVGAVVHSGHYRAAAEACCPGLVAQIPLAFEYADLPSPRAPTGRLVVATIGRMNANKRMDQVIRAIGASPVLRQRARYILVGDVTEETRADLIRLADRVGAPAPDVLGHVSDETLRILLAGVDAISCLRHPALEGGSASLILAARSGRPTLVSDIGCYAEVPDGLVLKCPPGNEAAHVVHHLEAILDDPEAALAMGRRAQAYAEATHSAEAYVAALLPFLETVAREAPAVLARGHVRRTLEGIGLPAGPADLSRASRGLDSLLGRWQEPP